MKKLGFGMMRLPLTNPDDQTSIDLEQTKELVDLFLSRGFTYFDTAWMYHGGKSEETIKEVLTSRYPRDAYTLTSKLHVGYVNTPEDRDRIFNEQLRKTGVEFFDYYLLHSLNADLYEKNKKFDCFRWIREKKAAGLVRHIGFSFHDSPEMLDKILTEQEGFEFVQLQINYYDWESENVRSRACYEVARKHGMRVIIMEPVKGGMLARLPAPAREALAALDPDASPASFAIRFAASLDGVMVVLSGMSTLEQVDDNTTFMDDMQPLSDTEREKVLSVAEIIRNYAVIPCTGCSYCTAGCPKEIPIPALFAIYNRAERGEGTGRREYAEKTAAAGRAGDCIGCGQCEGVCPQKISVTEWLGKVSARYDG